jgi:hypothetical protein
MAAEVGDAGGGAWPEDAGGGTAELATPAVERPERLCLGERVYLGRKKKEKQIN